MLQKFANKYNEQIIKYPLRTKMITTASVFAVGDVLSQLIEKCTFIYLEFEANFAI